MRVGTGKFAMAVMACALILQLLFNVRLEALLTSSPPRPVEGSTLWELPPERVDLRFEPALFQAWLILGNQLPKALEQATPAGLFRNLLNLSTVFNEPKASPRRLNKLAENGLPIALQAALYEGADVEEKDELGRTPLMLAIRSNNLDNARVLLAAGASLRNEDRQGRTAVDYAQSSANQAASKLLIEWQKNTKRGDVSGLMLLLLCFLLPALPGLKLKTQEQRYVFWATVASYAATAAINAFWFKVSESDTDSTVFLAATQSLGDGAYAGFYPRFLRGAFDIFGQSELLGSALSVLAFALAIIIFLRIAELLEVQNSWALLPLLALPPSMIIYYSAILREPWLLLTLLYGALNGVRFLKTRASSHLLLCLGSVAILASMHRAFILWIVIWLPLMILASAESKQWLSKRAVVALILGIGLIGCGLAWRNLVEGTSLQREVYLRQSGVLANEGRTSYPTPLNFESLGSLTLTAPAAFAAYLLYPLPSQWSSPVDVYAGLEVCWRLILLAGSLLCYHKAQGVNRVRLRFLLLSWFSLEFTWAMGTQNWGTALRHHSLAYPLLVLAGGPTILKALESSFLKLRKIEPPGFQHSKAKDDEPRSIQPKRKQFLATYVAAALALVTSLLSYRLSFQLLGAEGFAVFATCKRLMALGYPALTHGIGVALSHHVARSASGGRESPRRYLQAAVMATLLVTAPLFLLSRSFPSEMATLLFGSPLQSRLLWPLSLILLGTGFFSIISSFLAGKSEFALSSMIALLSGGLIPIFTLWFTGESCEKVFFNTGLILIGLGLIGTIVLLLQPAEYGEESLVRHFKRLCGYAAPRLPGVIGLAVLSGLPVVLAGHGSEDPMAVGVLALGCSLLLISQSFVGPTATVLLPYVTRLASQGKRASFRRHGWHLFLGITIVITPLIVVMSVLAGPILKAWIGPEAAERSAIFLWVMPAMLPYAYFECFKYILDGTERRALTTTIVNYALIAFVGTYFTLSAFHFQHPELPAFLLSFVVLGVSSLIFTERVLRDSSQAEGS